MGFWSSFFGTGAAHVYNEMKKEEKETDRWNDLFYELEGYENRFIDFLSSIGSPATFVFDVEYVNNGNIAHEKRKMDNYKRKINEYLSLGGAGEFMYELDDLDDYIKKVKYLNSNGYIDRQVEFCFDNSYQVQEKIKEERLIKEREMKFVNNKVQQSNINNYGKDIDIKKTFEINGAKFWISGEDKFCDFTCKIVYNNKNINIYAEGSSGVPLFEDKKLLGTLPVPTNQYFDVILEDSGNLNEKIVRLNDAIFVINTNDSLKIKSFYDSYNKTVDEVMVKEQNLIMDLYKKIDGINILADNLISTLDEPILLNHDAVIMMQTMWAYNKMKNTKLYDENAINNENLLMAIVLMQTLLENMAEIILESNTFSKQKALFVCWEATKIAAIKYYSNIWEKDYGRYIDSILPNRETDESTKFLVQYIKKILDCNEIESIDNFKMIAIFTYHIMDKGYTKEQLYFPRCFDQIIKIFDTIRIQTSKEKIKNQLKGNVKKQESNYTIDDVDLMNGNEFEHFICELFNKMGYKSNVTKQSGDQGLDVIAVKNGKRIGIQAKCYSYTVGNSAVQEVVAGKNFYHCDKVLVITNNYFTSSAKELAQVNDEYYGIEIF